MPGDQLFHWYEYLDNFFNTEPFSIIREINKIISKKRGSKRLSRCARRRLRTCRERLKEYIQKWGSDKMQDFRVYISTLLDSVFCKFAEREKFEELCLDHDTHYKQRSFFIVYNMMKKYLRSINTDEIYNGAIDKSLMRIISGISDYVPNLNYSSSEDVRSDSGAQGLSYLKMSRMSMNKRISATGSAKWSKPSKRIEEMDDRTQEAVKVLTAAIQIHKSYMKTVCEKKKKKEKPDKTKRDKFARMMKKKAFALAKGSKIRTPKEQKTKMYLDSPDKVNYNFMKKMQEIKAKKRALRKAAKKSCKNILYKYTDGKKEKSSLQNIQENVNKEEIIQKDGKAETRKEKWEASRNRHLIVRKAEKTEGERVLDNIKKVEERDKKEFMNRLRKGFEELFILKQEKKKSEVEIEEEWLIRRPSSKIYYERSSTTVQVEEEEEADLLEQCRSPSNISGDVTYEQLFSDISDDRESSPVTESESVFTNEKYLDDISDCFREIEEGAVLSSSCEMVKSSKGSDISDQELKEINETCIDPVLDGIADQTKFFKKIKKDAPEKLRSYQREDELSITSELMQELCDTSGSETSDATYNFQPPNNKIPEEKPDITSQPINFKDFNHRKLQLYLMEKQCKASDVSSVAESNVWNKAIFKLKKKEKDYYKKMGISEAYERTRRDLKHLILDMSKAKHRKPVVLDKSAKEDFLIDFNKRMFNEINFDDKKLFPIEVQPNKNVDKEDLKEVQSDQSSGHVRSLCPSGSCLKESESGLDISDEESGDLIQQTETMMKKLDLREPYKEAPSQDYERILYQNYGGKVNLKSQIEDNRPSSAHSDDREPTLPPTTSGRFGIARNLTIDEMVASIFPKENKNLPLNKDGDGFCDQEKQERKITKKPKSGKSIELIYTPSIQEFSSILKEVHPELQTDGSGKPPAPQPTTNTKEPNQGEKQQFDDIIDVESLLSRDEKLMEEDYYAVIKKEKPVVEKEMITSLELENRVKTATMRYTTIKSEKVWPKHWSPDYLYFFRPLMNRRLPVSFTNIKLRTMIPFLKPDSELYELPHYAMLQKIHPPISYENTEKIETRILWDRPSKFKINYSEIGDKHYVYDVSQSTVPSFPQSDGFSNITNTEGSELEEEQTVMDDFLFNKQLNWLTWNPPEFNNSLSNERLKRILIDLGAVPDIYEKFEILLKNPKLGYVPMKELLYNNQEKLFNYMCSKFLNKIATKYPKRFLRLPFFIYNQHGVQKHICTFIKPTKMKTPSLTDWQGCAKFITYQFKLIPLNSDMYPPLQLNGPDKTLYNQSGNLYELANLVECMLLGAGYDAYVVSGMVTQIRGKGIMDEQPPNEKDLEPPKTGFKRKQSEQPLTIEMFFKSHERDRLAERLEKVDFENLRSLEHAYIEQAKGEWKDNIAEKYRLYTGKMETPQGKDLIEKLKMEIKERQFRRKSTKELEKLLKKLQEERVQFLQDKGVDAPEEDAGALEEECKKYLYPPDKEITSVYAQSMELQKLKAESQEKQLLEQVGEEKKKKLEDKYLQIIYAPYQKQVYLPPTETDGDKEFEEEKYKFFDEIRQHLHGTADIFEQIYQEEKMSYDQQEEQFIRDDIYDIYFGEKKKKFRARKVKKNDGLEKEPIDLDDEKKIEDKKDPESAVSVPRKSKIKEDSFRQSKTENEKPEDEISDEVLSEFVSDEEFEAIVKVESQKKLKMNKKAIRNLKNKMEKAKIIKRWTVKDLPIEHPEPIVKVKAINPVVYCWILLKKNERDIDKDYFLDVKTGTLFPTTDKQFLRIDCLWNDKNYYIPIYQRKHIKKTRMFDFLNEKLWWHLLCGEPRRNQKLRRSMRDVEDPMIQKHLEVPRTWVGHMKFPKKRFDKIFKEEKMKTFRYKRVQVDVFEYGAEPNGIRKRVIEFYNMRQTRIKSIRETFEHRNDFLIYRIRFYRREKNVDIEKDAVKTSEVFEPGTTCQLKCFRRYKYADGRQIIDIFFYADFRPDFLKMFSITPKRIKMQFIKGRKDQLTKLKLDYFENTFFDNHHKEPRFNRIIATFHQKASYANQLKMAGYFEDPPIRIEIDLKVGLSYYFFKDEGEKELKYAIWELHYNIIEGTFINPDIHPNRVYFFGSSDERKTTLEREIMLEREQADKIKYVKYARACEKEINHIIKKRKNEEENVFIDVSRKSKWSPDVIEKLKIEQLYLMAQRVENRLNILREKNILNYFEDLAEGRQLDFVIMQILKSLAGEEFNLKLAQIINELFKKYQKAQKKGCPSAKTIATVAERMCRFIEAYREYFNKHSKEAEEYYRRYTDNEKDETDDVIRKYIYGEDFTNNLGNLEHVIEMFNPKSMDQWFDKWFKKEIRKYGAVDVREMIQGVDEILLSREPKDTKPIKTSFWKALGEFKNITEMDQDVPRTSEQKSTSGTDSDIKHGKNVAESSDTDTDDLCENVFTGYIDKKNEMSDTDQEESRPKRKFDNVPEEKVVDNLENCFMNKIKKLVRNYGIVNIREGLKNIGMEEYLYNIQKDIGNVDCILFTEDAHRKELDKLKGDLLKKRKRKEIENKVVKEKKYEREQHHSDGSTASFHDQVEKALSHYPWAMNPKEIDTDLKEMVGTLENELMKCSLKKYHKPTPQLSELEKPQSSNELIFPGWARTKKPNKQIEKVIPLIKKTMEGKMGIHEQKLLKNILFKLILKDQADASFADLENVFKKFSAGKDGWGRTWNNYTDRLMQLLTETYQQKVIEHIVDDYKYQEDYFKQSEPERSFYEPTDDQVDASQIDFEECDIPSSENTTENFEKESEDHLKDFNNIRAQKGFLPSIEDLLDRRKKIKEFEKKRAASALFVSSKTDIKTKKPITCENIEIKDQYPDYEDSDKSKSWFEEVHLDKRKK